MSIFSVLSNVVSKAKDFISSGGTSVLSKSPEVQKVVQSNKSGIPISASYLGAGISAGPSAGTTFAKNIPNAASSAAQATANVVKGAYSSFSNLSFAGKVATVTGGVIVAKSSKAQELLINSPKQFNQFTTDVATTIDKPSIQNASAIAKNSPLITGALTATTLGLVGYKTASLVNTALNTAAMRDSTKSAVSSGEQIIAASPVSSKNDVEIAKIQADTQLKLAKEQAKLIKEQTKKELEIAKATAKEQKALVPSEIATPTPASAVPATKKKATKKKKKAKPKKKKKATKKKAKKKAKPKAKKKKAKTIKRKKKKR